MTDFIWEMCQNNQSVKLVETLERHYETNPLSNNFIPSGKCMYEGKFLISLPLYKGLNFILFNI